MSQAALLRDARAASRAPFRSYDPAFADVLGDSPRLVPALWTDAHEGPVYVGAEDALYFTTLPRAGLRGSRRPQVSIKRVALEGHRLSVEPGAVSVISRDANAANGMTLGPDRRLLVCEQGSATDAARISRVDRVSGGAETLVAGFDGMPLNSPNDVVARSDGTVWFTDPSYGHLQGFRPEPVLGDNVLRHDPASGDTSIVANSFDKPNGLAFSPDESVLYVGDSGANQRPGSYHPDRPHHVKAFDVVDGRRLSGERVFTHTVPGFPDGLKVDGDGRVYVSAFSGVQVFDPAGGLIGEIELPGAVNFAFGGQGRNVLFITTDDAIWAAVLNATGPPPIPFTDRRER